MVCRDLVEDLVAFAKDHIPSVASPACLLSYSKNEEAIINIVSFLDSTHHCVKSSLANNDIILGSAEVSSYRLPSDRNLALS